MVPYYCWRPIPSTFCLPTHADLIYYQQPDTPSCCQHDLLRRPLLRMSISAPSVLHSPRHGRWFHIPTSLRFIARKNEVIYTHFFSQIQHIAQQHQLQLQPDTVFIDYETATNNAARTLFPGVIVKGCFFHFTQCIWRTTQKCGLQTYYKEDNDITRLVRRATVLPLVP